MTHSPPVRLGLLQSILLFLFFIRSPPTSLIAVGSGTFTLAIWSSEFLTELDTSRPFVFFDVLAKLEPLTNTEFWTISTLCTFKWWWWCRDQNVLEPGDTLRCSSSPSTGNNRIGAATAARCVDSNVLSQKKIIEYKSMISMVASKFESATHFRDGTNLVGAEIAPKSKYSYSLQVRIGAPLGKFNGYREDSLIRMQLHSFASRPNSKLTSMRNCQKWQMSDPLTATNVKFSLHFRQSLFAPQTSVPFKAVQKQVFGAASAEILLLSSLMGTIIRQTQRDAS